MSKPQVRASQLITTFGPGAMVDLPDDSVLIAGTDHWRYSKSQPIPTVSEPRLKRKAEALLKIGGLTLRKPPPAVEDKGFIPDITAFRFPEWFVVQRVFTAPGGHRARRLVNLRDLEGGKYRDEDKRKYSVVPVRFVRACPCGHVGDIDWGAFVHGADDGCRRDLRLEERGTSGDMDSIWVCCACGAERSMSQAVRRELRALGSCNGSRPWLGPGNKDKCREPNRLLIRSASNAYFPQLLSVISIPDSMDALSRAVEGLWESHLAGVQSLEELAFLLRIPTVRQALEGFSAEKILAVIRRKREGGEGDERPVKEVEFEALAEAKAELGAEEPDGDFYARALDRQKWAAAWTESVERVVLVHRLREVAALVGFTRLEAAGPDTQGELAVDVQRAPLGLDVSWLPAIENRGEGVFVQFKAEAVKAWLGQEAVKRRDAALQEGFEQWKKDHEGTKREYPGLAYYMLHSLSHLLMTAISLECGYPASSIRERVYAAPGNYGILIYTGSPDSEGTLGGLVEAGRGIREHMRRALDMGALCSNDPVCAFHAPTSRERQSLLGSACHGCLLIAETSCEQHNDFLDRALVTGTVEALGVEFFKA